MDAVSIEIEQHAEKKSGGFFDDLIAQSSKPQKVTKQDKEALTEAGDDFPTIIMSVLALVFSALSMPDEVKPNKDELSAVSGHLARIMLRHIDITNRLNADALDIIGIISTGAGWYIRVMPALSKSQKPEKTEQKPAPVEQPSRNLVDPGASMNDAGTENFLRNSAALAAQRLN